MGDFNFYQSHIFTQYSTFVQAWRLGTLQQYFYLSNILNTEVLFSHYGIAYCNDLITSSTTV